MSGGALETVLYAQPTQRRQASFGPRKGVQTASVPDIKISAFWFMGASLREVGLCVKSRFNQARRGAPSRL